MCVVTNHQILFFNQRTFRPFLLSVRTNHLSAALLCDRIVFGYFSGLVAAVGPNLALSRFGKEGSILIVISAAKWP